MRFTLTSRLFMTALIASVVCVSACSPKNEKSEYAKTDSADASDELKQQIEAKPVKVFAITPEDANDIALLEQYDQNFNEVSAALENDLKELEAQGNLTEDMKNQRKRDLIQSSLNMLKELDLKTEQGRYIQGLFALYWENQMDVYSELVNSPENDLQDPTDAVKGMGDYYTAEAQLKHWKSQQK
ncbi:hypothetical protein [Acinetobacter shaoyimingii]|uniref:Uncharacterized protein n=1 Tax=Acinetobacter shaoyimingii TaxID=2715164 RepID=A0A6G8RYH6_9GAMM|nr:hypothetical protein [Acinetobacter shaoyimingii]QIO06989.1 hypothetical protein G8E00_14130 [Acinetobacter shaoyimingii]